MQSQLPPLTNHPAHLTSTPSGRQIKVFPTRVIQSQRFYFQYGDMLLNLPASERSELLPDNQIAGTVIPTLYASDKKELMCEGLKIIKTSSFGAEEWMLSPSRFSQ